MRLAGSFKAYKAGTFKPEDGDGESFPYCFAKIIDSDAPKAGYVKVKPESSDPDDVAAFAENLGSLKKGDQVAWIVSVDQYGNVRYVTDAVAQVSK